MWSHFGLSPTEVVSSWLRGTAFTADWPQLKDRDVILTHQTRIGIALVCRLLNLSPGDEVLVPSYNCGSEIDPLLWYGLKPVFYRVDSRARIDCDDIRARLTPRTRMVYVIHYFGWPQELAELAAWCREQDLILIEDCAHSLFSQGPEGLTGTSGNAAVHCFWKTLPLPDGGALTLKRGTPDFPTRMKTPGFGSVCRGLKPFINDWVSSRSRTRLGAVHEWPRKLRRTSNGRTTERPPVGKELSPPEIPAHCYFDERTRDWSISRISRGLMNRADPQAIVQRRRHNYLKLSKGVSDLPGVRLLFPDLPQGVCPLVLPILVFSPHRWQQALYRRGIDPFSWWRAYHPRLSWDGFDKARELKDRMLAFPVHQYLSEDHIDRTINTVREVSCEIVATQRVSC